MSAQSLPYIPQEVGGNEEHERNLVCDGHLNRKAKILKLRGIKRFIPAFLLVAGSVAFSSYWTPKGYEPAPRQQISNVNTSESSLTEPSVREAMTNPIEEVRYKWGQSQEDGLVSSRIHEMFLQSPRRRQDAGVEIRSLSERTQASWSALDLEAARWLFRPEVEDGVGSNQESVTEVWSDWMVPSISMLEEGDVSIGPPANLYIGDWELIRDDMGHPIVGRVGQPLSRIRARAGMTLGEVDRIVAVRDTPDAFFLILENGKRIENRAGLGEGMHIESAPDVGDSQ